MRTSIGWAVLPVLTEDEARGRTMARWSRRLYETREAAEEECEEGRQVFEVFVEGKGRS